MKLTPEMHAAIDDAVLCWVATASPEGVPNVSPKEVFASSKDSILIAHIASPKTVRNIASNPKVMVSLVDVFEQVGWQFSGKARLLWPSSSEFPHLARPLQELTEGLYPIKAVLHISVSKAKRIVAPSSWLFPDQSKEIVRGKVLARYGVKDASTQNPN